MRDLADAFRLFRRRVEAGPLGTVIRRSGSIRLTLALVPKWETCPKRCDSQVLPRSLVPGQHVFIEVDPTVVTPELHHVFRILQELLALDQQRCWSSLMPIGLSYHIEQHAEFPIASLFRIEVIETRLGPGITEPFVRGNGFGRMSDEEGVVDGRIGQEGGRDE